jgi:hypothetical protein
MHHVGHQVVRGALLVLGPHLLCQEVAKLNVAHWKVHNGWIFLHKESVLGKPLDVENDEPADFPFYQMLRPPSTSPR